MRFSAILWMVALGGLVSTHHASARLVRIDRALEQYFHADSAVRAPNQIIEGNTPLSRTESESLAKAVWTAWAQGPEAAQLKKEIVAREIHVNGESMRFTLETMIDEKPPNGYPLFIAMHGGGATPPEINDRAWRGMQHRYKVPGKYLYPRAPRDTWDHWHNQYIHAFFQRLVEGMILHEQVDPNRVYIMGYSSGGYGVFQLGPILADRWAAVAVAAAGPTSSRPENLRNLPFNLQVGTEDHDYDRFKVASEFAQQLAKLHAEDPEGYIFKFIAHPGHGHRINDRSSVPWMAQYTRNPLPDKIVWVQGYETSWPDSNPVRHHFYWLATSPDYTRGEGRTDSATATLNGQTIRITAKGFDKLRVRLNDHMLNLDQPVTVFVNNRKQFDGKTPRTLSTMLETFDEYHDPDHIFTAEVEVAVPNP